MKEAAMQHKNGICVRKLNLDEIDNDESTQTDALI